MSAKFPEIGLWCYCFKYQQEDEKFSLSNKYIIFDSYWMDNTMQSCLYYYKKVSGKLSVVSEFPSKISESHWSVFIQYFIG